MSNVHGNGVADLGYRRCLPFEYRKNVTLANKYEKLYKYYAKYRSVKL